MHVDELYYFSPEEEREYGIQEELIMYQLKGAADNLDFFSCHSQPHVTEVMDECDMLAEAFRPWLMGGFDKSEWPWVQRQLKLAAKYHDIGMCGTSGQRELLMHIDYMANSLGAVTVSKDYLKEQAERLRSLADTAGESCHAFRDFCYMAQRESSDTAAMRKALCEFHDSVKSNIRRLHPLRAGRYILAHSEELRERYGQDTDIQLIASMVYLHDIKNIRVAYKGNDTEALRDKIVEFLDIPSESINDERLKRIAMLTSVLRLADTRRCGYKAKTLDGKPLVCEVSREGKLCLYKQDGNLRRQMPTERAFEILASEAVTEFGAVRVKEKNGGVWSVTHHITLNHAELAEARRIFGASRLFTYCEELDTASFAGELGFEHTVCIEMPGVTEAQAETAVREWKHSEAWLGNMGITLQPKL